MAAWLRSSQPVLFLLCFIINVRLCRVYYILVLGILLVILFFQQSPTTSNALAQIFLRGACQVCIKKVTRFGIQYCFYCACARGIFGLL